MHRRLALALVIVIALAGLGGVALIGGPAGAASTPASYLKYGLSGTNVAVVGLPGAKGYPRASVLVPKAWRLDWRGTTSIRFRTDKASCPYLVTFTARFALGDDVPVVQRVTGALPAPAAYVEEQGTRRAVAWRVVRQSGTQRLDGLQSAVAPPNWKNVPAGKRVFSELVAKAPKVNPSVSCHSGFYREVARQIGDALAVNVRAS